MKSFIATALLFTLSSIATAAPTAVKSAAAELRTKDVRTITKEVVNTDGNPCMPEGKSYQVDLQVKKALGFNYNTGKTVYKWETVKSVNVDKNGLTMEVCAE